MAATNINLSLEMYAKFRGGAQFKSIAYDYKVTEATVLRHLNRVVMYNEINKTNKNYEPIFMKDAPTQLYEVEPDFVKDFNNLKALLKVKIDETK